MPNGQLSWIRLLAKPVNLRKGCQQTRWVFSPLNCPNADFSSAKVVLKRYADNWVIEVFAGQKQESNTEIRMRRLAELAERLHTASTNRCDSWQEEMYQKHPCLQNVPVGANRRALCTVYLKARGLPSNQREVDLLAVEMMIVAAVMHLRNLRGLLSIGSPLPSGIGVKKLYQS